MLFSGGDDRRVLLWKIEKAIAGVGQAAIMKGEHNSNIFCLGFDSHCSKLFSAGNDELVMIHDTKTGETLDVILHNDAIYGLSIDPLNDNVFASACDDGRVCIWDIRGPARDPFVLARSSSAYHAVMYNPQLSRIVATANSKEGVAIWDVRMPKTPLLRYTGTLLSSQSAMSVRFNNRGTQVLALRRRLPPVLYNLFSTFPIAEFDHPGYYNSCTMKSCSFGGDQDQYVLSGSDDFNLYAWQIPDECYEHELSVGKPLWVDKANLVLRGHRSIVNQVRYNYTHHLIASSGVEKVIKFWSIFPMPFSMGGLENTVIKENRKVYSHEDYINLVLESGQFMTHDYSHQSVQEDPRMMAFFDSLVQRDIEGWTSDSSDDSIADRSTAFYDLRWANAHSDDSTSSSSLASDNESSNVVENSEADKNQKLRTVQYLEGLTKQIETNMKKSPQSDDENNVPSTSTGGTTDAEANKSPRVPSVENFGNSDLNRISQLIKEKKRDQMRKTAKFTVRASKKHLKRAKKCKRGSGSQSNQDRSCSKHEEKFGEMQKMLEFLKTRVDAGDFDAQSKNLRSQCTTRRRNRRLRYLTNESDLVFNEVLPLNSSSSSDSDDSNLINDELMSVLSNQVSRIREELFDDDSDAAEAFNESFENVIPNFDAIEQNRTATLAESESSSDNESLTPSSDKQKSASAKSVEENSESDSKETSSAPSRGVNIAKIYEEEDANRNDETSSDEEKCCHMKVSCPYKHNLCNPTTSAGVDSTRTTNSAIGFKPIDSKRRLYRKRKLSGDHLNGADNEEDLKHEKPDV